MAEWSTWYSRSICFHSASVGKHLQAPVLVSSKWLFSKIQTYFKQITNGKAKRENCVKPQLLMSWSAFFLFSWPHQSLPLSWFLPQLSFLWSGLHCVPFTTSSHFDVPYHLLLWSWLLEPVGITFKLCQTCHTYQVMCPRHSWLTLDWHAWGSPCVCSWNAHMYTCHFPQLDCPRELLSVSFRAKSWLVPDVLSGCCGAVCACWRGTTLFLSH